MGKDYCMLRMISSENNNKFYEMIYEGDTDFTVNYGRIELTKTTITKPYSEWNKIKAEKIKKGYKDVTHTVAETKIEKAVTSPTSSLVKISNSQVDLFINLMQRYTTNLVSKTYSVKATSVTKAQLEDAQNYINKLTKIDRNDEKSVNNILLDLYAVIPRYMSKVQLYLLPSIDFDKTFQQEQDNLDAMASQVAIEKDESIEEVVKEKTLLDILGITMDVLDDYHNNNELKYLVDQIIKPDANNYGYGYSRRATIDKIYKVNKPYEDTKFDSWITKQNNKTTKILIHGTRCTSVIPILEQGLKIRPSGNFSFSGKVYGDGNYFSETVAKSLGYVGSDPDKILLVYEVHTGNPFVYNGRYYGNSFALNYKELNSRGFDSTFVAAGNGMLNTEIIAYKEEQCRPKYIIHLK